MRPLRTSINPKSLKLIGIPKSFINSTLDDFEDRGNEELAEVKTFVKLYIESIDNSFISNSGLYFMGNNGVGKTMLSCIIAKEAYRHRYTTRRCTFVDYIDKYTKVWSASSAEKETVEDTLYTYYKSVEFLILDEVGKEIDSKVSAPILEDLLRYREDNGLVTIICTNLTEEAVLERYGNSCFSLLKGNLIPITMDYEDLRNEVFKEKVNP